MARRVADAEQDRTVERLREREGLVAPLPPVDGVVGVLQQVRAGRVGESVGHVSTLPATRYPREARRDGPTVGETGPMTLVATTFSTGWASGVNAYLVVLVLGLADRLGGFEQVPDQLARRDVLVAAGVLFTLELVVDKVPYLDSTWDVVSTVLRPTVGAALGVLLAGDAGADEAVHGTISGLSALLSHLVKAGTRLAVNASPEPFTNIGVSVGEDVTVVGVVALLLANPVLAFTLTLVLLVVGVVTLLLLARLVRRGRARWRQARPRPT